MNTAGRTFQVLLLLCLVLFAGAANGASSSTEAGEERRLLAEQHRLEQKIVHLRQEQDYLLFQQAFQQSASKYLLLDLAAGKGMLKYRNRVLRIFPLFRKKGSSGSTPGVLSLSEKTGKIGSKNRQLVFGDTLVLETRYRKRSGGHAARYGLRSKDIATLCTILEIGARAYIVPPP